MARPVVENHLLPSAVHWERLRAAHFSRLGRWDMAEECTRSADWFQTRLNNLLEGHLTDD